MDTHAAFRELENGGFEAGQAEALVRVISRSDSELVTKPDFAAHKKDIDSSFAAHKKDIDSSFATHKADIDAALTVMKADLKAEIAALKAEVAAMANKMIVGALAVAGLLFAALKLWP